MRWRDRLIGVVLGAILGIGIVTAFVFLYSEQTVDAPSLSGGGRGAGSGGGGRPHHEPPPVADVSVIGGAPPSSGPVELHYGRGDLVRLRVISDASVGVELLGYGISRTVVADQPELIRFNASKAGNFALIVSASHIDVARITVGRPPAP
jgi:hypothetical protein